MSSILRGLVIGMVVTVTHLELLTLPWPVEGDKSSVRRLRSSRPILSYTCL